MSNKTAPPPTNGSAYFFIFPSNNGLYILDISSKICLLPPAHFRNGFNSNF